MKTMIMMRCQWLACRVRRAEHVRLRQRYVEECQYRCVHLLLRLLLLLLVQHPWSKAACEVAEACVCELAASMLS